MDAKSKPAAGPSAGARPNYQLIDGRVVDLNAPTTSQTPRSENAVASDDNAQIKLVSALKLMRLDRPVGILLLLMPTLAALWLAAKGTPPFGIATIWFEMDGFTIVWVAIPVGSAL